MVRASLSRALLSDYFILGLAGVYLLGMAPAVPGLLSPLNLANLAEIALPLMVLAMGQTLVLMTGGIDLSTTSNVALCSVIGGMIMSGADEVLAGSALAMPVGVLAMLATGALVGLINGLSVARGGIPAFMVTLIGMLLLSGLAVRLTRSLPISDLPDAFVAISGTAGVALAVVLPVLVVGHLVLSRTVAGAWLQSVGQNAAAARVVGIPVERTVMLAYVACGVCSALAAILLTARLESASPVLGQRMLLDIVAASIIGGTSLFGGRGTIRGAAFGAILVCVVTNSLDLVGLTFAVVMLSKGAVILAAAALDAFRSRLLAKAEGSA